MSGLQFRVSGLARGVSGFGVRVSGFGFRVSGFGFRGSGFRSRFSDFGFGFQAYLEDSVRDVAEQEGRVAFEGAVPEHRLHCRCRRRQHPRLRRARIQDA